MRYFIIYPNGNEVEVSRYVLRQLDTVVEVAFDLESATIPSDFTMELDNNGGEFDSGVGMFAEENGERTRFLVLVTSAIRENVLFVGTVTDTRYTETSKIEIETRSVIASLLGCSFDMNSVSTWGSLEIGPPSRLVADLLGPNGLQLPGIFIDLTQYELAAQAETNIGLEMRLQIPNGERIMFTEFLQELNSTCGSYVYSQNGFMRYARQGAFDRLGYDVSFSGQVIAGTVKHARPVLWQKTKAVARYWNGSAAAQVSRTMADFFDTEGDTIMENFRDKVIESDGLGDRLIHNTLSSANAGLQDVLAWRGRPRWDFEFEVDAIAEDSRNRAQGIPLLSRARLIWDGGCVQLAIVEKNMNDQKSVFKGKSLLAPTFIHPAKRLLPVISQTLTGTQWLNNTPFNLLLYYMLDGDTAFTKVTINAGDLFIVANPSLLDVTWKISWGLPCGEIPSEVFTFTPVMPAGFFLGINSLGDTL